MKKIRIPILIIFLIGLFISFGMASNSYYQDNVHPVQFYVIDNDGDGVVDLSITNLFIENYDLQYSLNNSSWTTVSSDGVSFNFDKIDSDRIKVYWRLYNEESEVTYADLKFQAGYNDHDDTLWNSVIIYWNGGESGYTFETPSENDKVAPAPVPIPPSAWLLGVGLAGFFVFRRREDF